MTEITSKEGVVNNSNSNETENEGQLEQHTEQTENQSNIDDTLGDLDALFSDSDTKSNDLNLNSLNLSDLQSNENLNEEQTESINNSLTLNEEEENESNEDNKQNNDIKSSTVENTTALEQTEQDSTNGDTLISDIVNDVAIAEDVDLSAPVEEELLPQNEEKVEEITTEEKSDGPQAIPDELIMGQLTPDDMQFMEETDNDKNKNDDSLSIINDLEQIDEDFLAEFEETKKKAEEEDRKRKGLGVKEVEEEEIDFISLGEDDHSLDLIKQLNSSNIDEFIKSIKGDKIEEVSNLGMSESSGIDLSSIKLDGLEDFTLSGEWGSFGFDEEMRHKIQDIVKREIQAFVLKNITFYIKNGKII
jgi:hypothetical protein